MNQRHTSVIDSIGGKALNLKRRLGLDEGDTNLGDLSSFLEILENVLKEDKSNVPPRPSEVIKNRQKYCKCSGGHSHNDHINQFKYLLNIKELTSMKWELRSFPNCEQKQEFYQIDIILPGFDQHELDINMNTERNCFVFESEKFKEALMLPLPENISSEDIDVKTIILSMKNGIVSLSFKVLEEKENKNLINITFTNL